MIPMLLGLASKINTLLDRLTATRAGYLDNLDATVTSRASAATWTSALATKLNTYAGYGAQVKVYTASGSFVVPTGVEQLLISGCGGGGGGCGGSGVATGAGGGGGVRRMPVRVTPADTLTLTIGAGGAGGVSGNGSNGGDTGLVDPDSFQVILIPGGIGSTPSTAGVGGWSSYTDQTRDVAGGAAGGSSGADGGDFLWHQGGTRTSPVTAGGGGACMFGAGGDGSTASGVAAETMTEAAHGYGGGGGGGSNAAGGTGRSGLLIIEWFGVAYGS